MKLALQEIDKSGVVRIAAEGEITIRDFADAGKNPLEAVLGVHWASHRVLLNMEQISFIDSSAIGWMIDCHRRFRQAGGRLVFCGPTPGVREMIDLLKMRQVLDIYETQTQAEAALMNGQAESQGQS
jgi:anti-anti-sigma factor